MLRQRRKPHPLTRPPQSPQEIHRTQQLWKRWACSTPTPVDTAACWEMLLVLYLHAGCHHTVILWVIMCSTDTRVVLSPGLPRPKSQLWILGCHDLKSKAVILGLGRSGDEASITASASIAAFDFRSGEAWGRGCY